MSYRPAFSAPNKRRSSKLLLFFLLINIFGWMLSGCSMAAVGGADNLPDAQRSKIYFYSDKGVATTDWSIDGTTRSTFALGHLVPAGRHQFRNGVETKVEECIGSYYGVGRRGGYNSGIAGPCFETRYTGQCSGTITTEGGKSYSIRAGGSSGVVTLAVTDEATDQVAGYGTCDLARN